MPADAIENAYHKARDPVAQVLRPLGLKSLLRLVEQNSGLSLHLLMKAALRSAGRFRILLHLGSLK